MADNFKTKIIVNPNSANGRTGRNWPAIEAEIRKHLPDFDYKFTSAPLDATMMSRAALEAGYEMVVAAGGDGTTNEVVNGFFDNGIPVKPGAVLGVLPQGTGGDFRKTIGIGKKLHESAPVLAGKNVIRCDAGWLEFVDHSGGKAEKYFINITSFGIGGLVDKIVNQTSKGFGGFISFFVGALRAQMIFKNKEVSLELDGKSLGVKKVKNVIIANGQYFGGGMRIAKDALIDSGLFDIIIMGDLTMWESTKLLRSLYNGNLVNYKKKVEFYRAKEVRAHSDEEVLIDMDGEQPGRIPITLKILPGAINIKAPENKMA